MLKVPPNDPDGLVVSKLPLVWFSLLSSTISYIGSVLEYGPRTAGQMSMLLQALDEQKATAVGGASGGAAAKKRSLEEALGEIRDECRAKLRKANGEPNVEVVGEAV